MRSGEIHVQEEGLLRFALDEPDGSVGELLVDLRCQSDTFLGKLVSSVILKDPTSVSRDRPAVVVDLRFHPFGAARCEQSVALFVTAVDRSAIVHPFAHVPCVIPGAPHAIRPAHQIGIHSRAEHTDAVTKSVTASHNLGAARNTERIWRNGSGERHALPDKRIQGGSVDERVSQRVNRVRPLVVGNDEKDIRPTVGRHVCLLGHAHIRSRAAGPCGTRKQDESNREFS